MTVPARTRWRCRRGIREMDIILERFLKGGYPHLASEERQAFEELLDYPDQELLACLTGREPMPEGGHGRMLAIIRRVAIEEAARENRTDV